MKCPSNTWLNAALITVAGGKFHVPAGPIHSSSAYCPTRTVCGMTIEPQNYFVCEADANRYTGGRLATFKCKLCARP